jgi:cation transport protein ChaC
MWVFGYASLIWRPEFEFAERRMALAYGWHRALRMRSRVNRGSPQTPGLVFALLRGGACKGFAYRMHAASAKTDIDRLWAREMPNPVYEPRLLPLRTPQGPVLALAFTLNRRSDACLPRIDDEKLLDILRQARGRYGTTLDYLVQTSIALREHQLFDSEIERQVSLAKRHGLV